MKTSEDIILSPKGEVLADVVVMPSCLRDQADSQRPGNECEASDDAMKGIRPSVSTTFCSATERIDNALHSLKSELMAMRDQDVQLLKQLIHINDNIRHLKRTSSRRVNNRSVSFEVLRSHTSSCFHQLQGQGPSAGSSVLGVSGQLAESGHVRVPFKRASTLPSTFGLDPINDTEEDDDSLYGSGELDQPSNTPLSPSLSPISLSPKSPGSPSLASLTFTQEELRNGDSYTEILKRNVRLWKWNVAREETGDIEGEPSLL